MSESTRTTGDTPVEGLDPGGTHSTHPGKPTDKGPTVGNTVEGVNPASGQEPAATPD